jgi:hypothetical protein
MELSALANAGELTPSEWTELKEHLLVCEECREIHNEYLILDREGMPMLAAAHAEPHEQGDWDESPARAKLFARIRDAETSDASLAASKQPTVPMHVLAEVVANRALWATVAACVVVAITFGAYRFGSQRANITAKQIQITADRGQIAAQNQTIQALTAQKRAVIDQLESQTNRLAQLEAETPQKEQDLARLRSELQAENERLAQLAASKTTTEGQLQAALQQRDSLTTRLATAEQNYEAVRAELVNLRAERDRAVLRMASLESRVEDLSLVNREQERRLRNADQYLSSDRDIRELMGARKLYIADVYDVDSRSRTRKPFGRVFYTQGKSLIFYAFDLDRQPGLRNASAFQVWGQRGSDEGQPLNLGILYQDSEANRRWVLRFDDPKQLDEINAVFVTVEPNGGSPKPTSKPFLYALLRKEANHP